MYHYFSRIGKEEKEQENIGIKMSLNTSNIYDEMYVNYMTAIRRYFVLFSFSVKCSLLPYIIQ